MSLSYWTAAPRGPRAARWERLWLALGARAPLAGRLEELKGSRGLALVDISLLGPRPAAALAGLRARSPGLHVIACAWAGTPPEAFSAALAAGALDLFQEAHDDESLLARLRGHLARLFPGQPGPGVLTSGGIRLNLLARDAAVLRGRAWRPVKALTAREFDLLAVLAGAPGRVFTRAELLEGFGDEASLEAVDKGVAALRKKLGGEGKRLKTQRGVGYVLEA